MSAIRQEWSFDKDYTSYQLHDHNGQLKPVASFVETAIRNLQQYDYFVELQGRGGRTALGHAGSADGNVDDGRLVMRFTIPLAKPVNIATSVLTLSVYDPTYYIEFAHGKDGPVAFEGPGGESCSASIKDAVPSARARDQALAMDRNAPVDRSLGKLFAQTVTLRC